MNFCSKTMGTKIDCSCLCSDGFEADNLLETVTNKAVGFQAERFAHTPVFVTLYFSIPIQIKSIVITPHIGRQCAGIVQIYTLHSLNVNDKSLQASDITFRSGTAELHEPTTLHFRNVHYISVSDHDDSPKCDDRHHVVDLQGKLHHVVAVKVGIMRMYSGSVPSIKSLKVWATPSRSCGKDIKEQFQRKWKELNHKHLVGNQIFGNSSSASMNTNTLHAKSNTDERQPISTEFLDPITCTVMENPVLLPSGQTIDRATLDKHILSQTEWGRPPSDPFTGISFTEAYQPVPNVSLKLRLDQQLINNSVPTSSGKYTPSGLATNGKQNIRLNERRNEISQNHCFKSKSVEQFSTLPNSQCSGCPEVNDSKLGSSKSAKRVLRIPQTLYNPLRCCNCKTLFSSLTTQYLLPCRHKLCRTCLLATTSLICPYCMKKFERKSVGRTFS